MNTSAPLPRRGYLPTTLVLVGTACLAACDHSPPPSVRHTEQNPPVVQVQREDRSTNGGPGSPASSQKQRQAEFLNRLRAADPQYKTIDRAVLNGQNELGLVLDRSVSLDSIPALMRTMLAQMAKEFPGQDLEVVAYAPSNPPMKIGTARLDARTRDMTYTKEHP